MPTSASVSQEMTRSVPPVEPTRRGFSHRRDMCAFRGRCELTPAPHQKQLHSRRASNENEANAVPNTNVYLRPQPRRSCGAPAAGALVGYASRRASVTCCSSTDGEKGSAHCLERRSSRRGSSRPGPVRSKLILVFVLLPVWSGRQNCALPHSERLKILFLGRPVHTLSPTPRQVFGFALLIDHLVEPLPQTSRGSIPSRAKSSDTQAGGLRIIRISSSSSAEPTALPKGQPQMRRKASLPPLAALLCSSDMPTFRALPSQ